MTNVTSLFVKTLEVHQAVYQHSGGWIGHRILLGIPTLLLRTVGRRTGKERTSALTYGRTDGKYLVTASNGGSSRPPAWLLNVGAQPECAIQVGRRTRKALARTVLPGDTDYARYWDIVNSANRGQYRAYQEKTKRPIAIVELTPR
ncbi:nitroreductase/quinone reductase family protein [Aldersonia kunmingensis]|uniref:nitroreductase/quinone reductase family protein n=1 Tax=Aldersonia kunmingensis TaxID=408066 RepID=UPI00082CA516|nr:nitroreductase/quinone reductase family protein [Aldersonia kunmingensis]